MNQQRHVFDIVEEILSSLTENVPVRFVLVGAH